jgi:low temperature requirement protein LtrA
MAASPARIERVSTLELFFDLVFVFTITELTDILVDEPTLRGLAQVALLLGVIWWMYGGYAWLTNAVSVDRFGRRLLLLGGMAGFFVLALAVPDAFTDPGPALGLAYLAVVVVHSALFGRAASVGIERAMARITPFNVLAAFAVLAGLWIGGTAAYVLLGLAIVLEWGTPRAKPVGGFEIGPAHFVERHGLVVIVALGESIVAIGLAVREAGFDAGIAATALLGLALSAGLWFVYFGADRDHAAEAALDGASPERRPRMALDAFGAWHLGILLGIIVLAAGLKKAVAEPFEPATTAAALFTAGGLALYLLSEAGFRRALGLAVAWPPRLAASALVAATVPLATAVAGFAQLAALAAIVVAMLLAQDGAPPAWASPLMTSARGSAAGRRRESAPTAPRRP